MSTDTPRLALPLLAAGQAQKELWHNEALILVDQLLQASVVAWNVNTPPAAPLTGQSWIVGAAPVGDWIGNGGAVATWSDGGWRYVPAIEGLSAWSQADAAIVRHVSGTWRLDPMRDAALVIHGTQVVGAQAAAIPDPTGGTVADDAARSAIAAMLTALRHHGLIAD